MRGSRCVTLRVLAIGDILRVDALRVRGDPLRKDKESVDVLPGSYVEGERFKLALCEVLYPPTQAPAHINDFFQRKRCTQEWRPKDRGRRDEKYVR